MYFKNSVFNNYKQKLQLCTFVLLLHKVADDLVVEVRHLLPLDTLALVLLLLTLQGEFDEDLLQLLVTVVDAHLFKRVRLKCLKTKDVQHSNRQSLLFRVVLKSENNVVK